MSNEIQKKALVEILQAKQSRINELSLFDYGLISLPPEIGQLVQLVKLDLSLNRFSSLPPQIFQLKNLTTLNLYFIGLRTLKAEIGQLVNLAQLDLSYNKFTVLPPEIGQLSSLTSLNLSGNKLESLPAEIGQLSSLTSLNLSGNKLESLPAEIGQLSSLTSLNLSGNKLESLPAEIGQLSSLTSLNISGNNLSNLLADFISKFVNLKTLNLSTNNLSTLPPEIGQIASLINIDLSVNNFSELPAEFAQLINLRKINLKNNSLNSLPSEIVQLTNLDSLNLSNNNLSDFDQARAKIILHRNQQSTYFSIQDFGLTNLPTEIGQLTNITTLTLTGNNLTDLPVEISQLINLTNLTFRNNNLTDLPAGVFQLTNLTNLDLQNNNLADLPAGISQLTNLTNLDLQNNNLADLPAGISQLTNLTNLNLQNNNLTDLSAEVSQLTNLTNLNLRNNNLTDLPVEISQLVNLINLDLRNNSLKRLPIKSTRLKKLETLLLHDNNLSIPVELLGKNVSLEILKKNDPKKNRNAQKILSYLREIYQGRQLNETKMLVVGQGNVGKTSVIRRLVDDTFASQSDPTEGIDIDIYTLQLPSYGDAITLNIWDFGGQEHMHATHQFFLTQRSIYLYVLNARIDRDANKPDYWLNLIEQYGGESAPIILVINKHDSNPALNLNESALRRAYNIVSVIKTECETGEGIDTLRQSLVDTLDTLPHIGDLIPESWSGVKQALEKDKETKDIIQVHRFEELCKQYKVEVDSRLTLLELLHDLGTVLNYYKDEDSPALNETKILNPEWVTDGIYKIITAPMIAEKGGVLHRRHISEILPRNKYSTFSTHEFIMGMMEQFELAYPFNAKRRYLIPDLLPDSEPEITDFKPGETLNFEYRYASNIPPSIFSRFVVRQHEKIRDRENLLWRNGVVVEFDNMQALVRADGPSKKLTIAARGEPKNRRRELLAVIRSTFDAIHSSFAKIEVERMVCIPNHNSAVVSYDHLLIHEEKGWSEIYVPDLKDRLPVKELLEGVDGVRSNKVIREILERFSLDELEKVSVDFRDNIDSKFDYEEFHTGHRPKSEVVLKMVVYLEKRNLADAFLDQCRKTYPDFRGF